MLMRLYGSPYPMPWLFATVFVSLCSPVCSGTSSVDQAGLKLTDICLSLPLKNLYTINDNLYSSENIPWTLYVNTSLQEWIGFGTKATDIKQKVRKTRAKWKREYIQSYCELSGYVKNDHLTVDREHFKRKNRKKERMLWAVSELDQNSAEEESISQYKDT